MDARKSGLAGLAFATVVALPFWGHMAYNELNDAIHSCANAAQYDGKQNAILEIHEVPQWKKNNINEIPVEKSAQHCKHIFNRNLINIFYITIMFAGLVVVVGGTSRLVYEIKNHKKQDLSPRYKAD